MEKIEVKNNRKMKKQTNVELEENDTKSTQK